MTSFARTEMLERKVEKHMREHANEMKLLRSELQTLKMRPRMMMMREEIAAAAAVKDQRPLNDGNKKLTHMPSGRNKMTPTKSLKKAHNDDKSLNTNNYYSGGDDGGDKMTNNNVNKMKMVSGGGSEIY